jgi:16S rRNA processing protein RimM
VFAPGFVLVAASAASTWKVERARAFKDGWLVKFEGIEDKNAADRCRGVELSADESVLEPPDENEVYLDELTGMTVRDEPHGELGTVAGYYELPQGLVLEMRGEKWRADIPFNEAFVSEVNRNSRLIIVKLPEGLLEPAR